MEQMKCYKKLMEQLDGCYKELADIIKSKGGMIKINYTDETTERLAAQHIPDYMYAEVYNSSGDIAEWYIHGLSVDKEGNISVAASYWREEDDDFLDCDENWDSLYCGEYTIYGATLINILEVIHEFI